MLSRTDGRILLRSAAFLALVVTASPALSSTDGGGRRPPARSSGLGVIVGEPTGFTGQTWTGRSTAIDVAAAWSFDRDSIHVHADHLWYSFGIFDHAEGFSPAMHYGLGGRIRIRDGGDDAFGVRFPVGLTHFLDRGRIGLFVEIAPTVNVVEETDLDVEGGLGARYFFH